MLPKDIFKKIRRIEITTSRLVTDIFSGQYHSVFKGRGMEFDEVREYDLGDDIRLIDWNVTARTGRAHIKKFVEERELTVMILVDVSSSCRFGTIDQLKSQLAAEMAAVLSFSAIRNNDKAGLILFTDRIEKFIPPRKGTRHVLRVVREVIYPALYEGHGLERHGTDICQALEYLNRVTTRKTITFLISDFFQEGNNNQGFNKDEGKSGQGSDPLKKALSLANKRHDIIAVALNDPREYDLADCGLLALEEAESGRIRWVDSTDRHVREQYRQYNQGRRKRREELFRSVGVDYIDVSTDLSYSEALVKFFLKRKRRQG